jgi:hypothetical protein
MINVFNNSKTFAILQENFKNLLNNNHLKKEVFDRRKKKLA